MSVRLGISEQRAASSEQRRGASPNLLRLVSIVSGSRHLNFKAYRLAAGLADAIRKEVTAFKSFDLWTVGVQLVRSADSIGANIAEGLGRGTLADQRRLFLIARGSVLETEHWLERAAERNLLEHDAYRDALAELGRMLNGLIRADPERN
jgi:four helix bundle protein